MFRYSTLVLAILISAPALWQGFVTGEVSTTTALVRFLIAVPVSAVLLGVLRTLVDHYRRQRAPRPTVVEATRLDGAVGDEPET